MICFYGCSHKEIFKEESFSLKITSKKNVIGTPPREEYEFKRAYKYVKNISIDQITSALQRNIQNALNTGELSQTSRYFERKPFHLDTSFQSFAFLDYYIDSKDYQIREMASSYRLRYRWSALSAFLRHQLFPWFRFFHPSRCEIQYKSGYKKGHLPDSLTVQEARLEFRKESHPFLNQEMKLPPSPWKQSEFMPYALTGKYQERLHQPGFLLRQDLKVIEPSKKEIKLRPVAKAITKRYRNHLNLKNPFGTGPNPEQVFIITLDHSRFESLQGENHTEIFLEIEVEIDRNMSTELNRFTEYYDNPEVQAFTIQAKNKVFEDHKALKTIIFKTLDSFNLEKLSSNFKYARFVDTIRNRE